MKSNRKELAILRGKRTPETLDEWAKVFGEGDRQKAQRYAMAVATFLGQNPDGEWSDYLGQLSPNTRKAYAFAVTEFFEWAAAKHGRVVPPHVVMRKDAEDYVAWLANRPFSLAEEKLKDGDMQGLLQLFEIIKELSTSNIREIIRKLSDDLREEYFGVRKLSEFKPGDAEDEERFAQGRHALSKDIRSLITMDIVEGTPTLTQLRKDFPQAGITLWEIQNTPLDEVFKYSVKSYAPVARTTVALRISALSTFWKILMQGENMKGGEALLQYDVWDAVKKRVNRGIAPMKREASRTQKVPTETVLKMLKNAPSNSLVQMRDKAILYLTVFTGVRTTEILKLRRSNPAGKMQMPYFDGSEPPAIRVLRKGNKWMRIPYPPVALKPLIEFQARLEKLAAPPYAQGQDPKAPNYHPYGIGYYFQNLQLPDAPLFPALRFWGANDSEAVDYRKSMSRVNLFKIFRKIAIESGLSDDEAEKVHPHAIRHFAANAMILGGKDLREVQHILGHTSITTTEGYLEDIEDDVKLSGQAEILNFLEAQGVYVDEAPSGSYKRAPVQQQPDTIDTYAIDVEEDVVSPDDSIDEEEIEIISTLSEVLPDNEVPQLPSYDVPENRTVTTAEGDVLITGDEKHLVGLADSEEPSQELLDNLIQTMKEGKSPGSPDWVYEALATQGDYESVVFNRGGQRDKGWLDDSYPKIPKDFGVGRESLLPWFVKAKGNVSHAGFFRDLPPFPVWAYEQVTPDTRQGEAFVTGVERLYMRFMQGDPSKGIAPSPIRGVGLIKWFGFFAYHSRKFTQAFEGVFEADRPIFRPWDSLVELRDLRMHKDEWLMEWLEKNSHTFRASVDAMKRGVPSGKPRGHERQSLEKEDAQRDPGLLFLKSSFEGIDLIDKMPTWMIEDDPIHALFEESPKEYAEFVKWLRNVTGQALSRDRDRELQEADDNTKVEARELRDLLVGFYKERDRLEAEKKKGSAVRRLEIIRESRTEMRQFLLAYLVKASGEKITFPLSQLEMDRATEFNKSMGKFFKDHNVPNPDDKKYRDIPRVQDRITRMVKDMFPSLEDLNVFADSTLFDPRWFRIDEENHTIFIEEQAAAELKSQLDIRQSPQLLVRRSARAMWEAREKGYDKLWGVMMSYFAWIVPTGAQMEAEAKGIDIAETGRTIEDRGARQEWLTDYVRAMKTLAEGATLKKALREKKATEGQSAGISELDQLIQEQRGDMQDHAMAGVDWATMTSVDSWDASPEDLLIASEEGSYYPNKRVGLLKNGRNLYLHMQGEKPKGWYRVDLFGGTRTMTPNAAPVSFVSPGVLYNAQKKVEPARMLLPSPFRMIAAMSLE